MKEISVTAKHIEMMNEDGADPIELAFEDAFTDCRVKSYREHTIVYGEKCELTIHHTKKIIWFIDRYASGKEIYPMKFRIYYGF